MKRLSGRDFLVAQASNASPARILRGDRASCALTATKTTGKMPVGPTAKMAVLRSIST
jgi:hypothetical protein